MTETPTHKTYDKLVRDRIPEIIKNSNRRPEFRTLDKDDEYLKYLIKNSRRKSWNFLKTLLSKNWPTSGKLWIRAFADVLIFGR